MLNAREFARLKEKADRLKEAAAKAKGVYEQKMKELKEKYGCNTIEEAEQKLEQMEQELEELEEEFDEAYKEFMDKWGDKLNAM